jgi:uncharacterized protein with PIN domain
MATREDIVMTRTCDMCNKSVSSFAGVVDQYHTVLYGLHKTVYYGCTNKFLDLCPTCSDKLQRVLKETFGV